MENSNTPEEWEIEIGHQLRNVRLRQNKDQQQLAVQAGISPNTVKNIESGKGATLKSFIRILRVLGRTEWLQSLAPEVSISPIQMLKAKAPRQRASRVRKSHNV